MSNYAERSFDLSLLNIQLFDINIHNDRGYTGIELALQSLATGLKQSALTIRQRKHSSTQNNEKFINSRSNFITTDKKIMNELQELDYQQYIYSSRFMKCKTII